MRTGCRWARCRARNRSTLPNLRVGATTEADQHTADATPRAVLSRGRHLRERGVCESANVLSPPCAPPGSLTPCSPLHPCTRLHAPCDPARSRLALSSAVVGIAEALGRPRRSLACAPRRATQRHRPPRSLITTSAHHAQDGRSRGFHEFPRSCIHASRSMAPHPKTAALQRGQTLSPLSSHRAPRPLPPPPFASPYRRRINLCQITSCSFSSFIHRRPV